MKYAVVDIGSNTIRLIIYEVSKNGEFQRLMDKKSVAGLRSYVEDGKLSKKGIEKLVSVMSSFEKILKLFDAKTSFVFATASLRNIKNSEDVIKEVKNRTGVEIELLSGEDEAYLGYLGTISEFNLKSGINIDIGGGSTEIISYKEGVVTSSVSLDEGSLSLYMSYVDDITPDEREIDIMSHYIKGILSTIKVDKKYMKKEIVGVGGTIRALRNIVEELYPDYEKNTLKLEELTDLLEKIKNKDKESMHMVLRINPSRIHTLMPGLVILLEIMKKYEEESIKVSDNGIREGYLKWKIQKK